MVIELLLDAGLKEFQVSIGQIDFFKGFLLAAGLDEEQEFYPAGASFPIKTILALRSSWRNRSSVRCWESIPAHAGAVRWRCGVG